jgi:hypothetical protein
VARLGTGLKTETPRTRRGTASTQVRAAVGLLLLSCGQGCFPTGSSGSYSQHGVASLEWTGTPESGGQSGKVPLGRCILQESTCAELVSEESGRWSVRLVPGSGGCLIFSGERLGTHEQPGDDLDRWVVVLGWNDGSFISFLDRPKERNGYLAIVRLSGEPPGVGIRQENLRIDARKEKDGVVMVCKVEFNPANYSMKGATFLGKVFHREPMGPLLVR